jgi:hypothetical protein
VAKKNIIHMEYEVQSTIIGLACHERIWKLVWKLNQLLGCSLATEEDKGAGIDELELYSDTDGDPQFEYLLFEPSSKPGKMSKVAQQFRYWLVIRNKKAGTPDVEALLRQMATIDIVSLAQDLTTEKDIQKLLP